MATILVVDDRDANRELVIAVLQHQGHRLLQAGDGAEALHVVRSTPCDLVITDILMPRMDGYEFVRRLRSDAALASTKVIFFTAHYGEDSARSMAKACSVDHVLMKPCEPGQLLQTVDALLAQETRAVTVGQEFEQAHLRLVTDKLSQKNSQLRIASGRLSVLTDLNLDLASERDPARLIKRLCSAARKLLGASYAFAGAGRDADILPRHFATEGMDVDLEPPALEHGVPGQVLQECRPRRLRYFTHQTADAGLPPSHPPFGSLICAPITSPSRAYGWVCVTNEPTAKEFGEEDEQLLTMLAAVVGRIYENGSLYVDIRSEVDRLEREISGHQQSTAEIVGRNVNLEQHARKSTARLAKLISEIESLTHALSHHGRAPLRSLDDSITALLGNHAAKLDQEGNDYLHRIASAARQVELLVAGLLTTTRGGS